MAHEFALQQQRSATFVETVARRWRAMLRDIFNPYRPELHYMRGPGPKWRERHGNPGATL